MSGWDHLPKPEGVGDIRETHDGFETLISIPTDEDGYFGRECPACEAPFKMRHDEYEALPEEIELTCPYCGHREEQSSFMSSAQHARVMAAAEGLAEQWSHEQANDIFSRTFGRRAATPKRSNSFVNVEWSYTPGTPPRVRELPAALEEQTRRIVECSVCGNHHAVYSATSFCPVCGPRPASARVLEATAAAREALALEDLLGEDERETLRAAGVFERFDDTAELFSEHAGLDLLALAGAERWERLKRAFARRHLLTHKGGIVDQKFLDRVPDSGLKLGQRLVVRRADAAQALDDLDAVVQAVSAA